MKDDLSQETHGWKMKDDLSQEIHGNVIFSLNVLKRWSFQQKKRTGI